MSFKKTQPLSSGQINAAFSRLRPALAVLTMASFFFLLTHEPLEAQRTKSSQRAGEQRHAEKGLNDNRYFFYFINSSVSNFGTEEDKKLFKEAIQRDILARQLYMKFLFHESFTEILTSQKILIDLYKKTIASDLNSARGLLNTFAAGVIHSDSHRARHYLRLGYRDSETAIIDMVMADNYREKLYSMRLYKYVRAIKSAKHARRYAFLAMTFVRADDPLFETHSLSHGEFGELVKKISDSPEEQELHSIIHLDNYYLFKNEKSFYDEIWENPNLKDIPEYEKYMKIN